MPEHGNVPVHQEGKGRESDRYDAESRDTVWPYSHFEKMGLGPCRMSMSAITDRLKTQLPYVSEAMSGVSARATELTPVIQFRQGGDASHEDEPDHALPRPVFSAITSPYLDRFVPQTTITPEQTMNAIHKIAIEFLQWDYLTEHSSGRFFIRGFKASGASSVVTATTKTTTA
jgi:hypothetical protein